MIRIAFLVSYLAIGLYAGVWEARDFPRRLDRAYPGPPPTKLAWGGAFLVACYTLSWPTCLLLDFLVATPVGRRKP